MISLTGNNAEHGRRAESSPTSPSDQGPQDLIEAFSAALLLIDEELRVLKCNVPARKYLGSQIGDGFVRLLSQTVAARSQEMRKQIREALVQQCSTSLLVRTADQPPLICTVRPIPEPALAALVSLIPLNGGSAEVIPHLRRLYKLSNAEAEIAATAASGMEVVEMANSRQVSIHTLRTQIASIKAKMGLSRMTEIAVTVCRLESAVTWL